MIELLIFYCILSVFIQCGYVYAYYKQYERIPMFNIILAPVITPVMLGIRLAKV